MTRKKDRRSSRFEARRTSTYDFVFLLSVFFHYIAILCLYCLLFSSLVCLLSPFFGWILFFAINIQYMCIKIYFFTIYTKPYKCLTPLPPTLEPKPRGGGGRLAPPPTSLWSEIEDFTETLFKAIEKGDLKRDIFLQKKIFFAFLKRICYSFLRENFV